MIPYEVTFMIALSQIEKLLNDFSISDTENVAISKPNLKLDPKHFL